MVVRPKSGEDPRPSICNRPRTYTYLLYISVCMLSFISLGRVVCLPIYSTGSSTMCAINRAGIYILLSILINLCFLMYEISTAVAGGARRTSKVGLNILSTAIPILLMTVGYLLDGDLYFDEGENAKLNIARHAFSCSMRCVSYVCFYRASVHLGSP